MADIIFEDEESVVIRMRMRRASFDDLVMLCGSRTLALKAVREAVESLSSSDAHPAAPLTAAAAGRPAILISQPQIRQARMIVGASTERPMKFTIARLDRQIVDTGDAPTH